MMLRPALLLVTLALLSGCGKAALPAQTPLQGQVAAAGIGFDHMEQEYSYKLGSKAAKAFVAKAKEIKKADGTTCELKEDGGFFGSTIKIKLAGTVAGVMAAREALDALYKSLK